MLRVGPAWQLGLVELATLGPVLLKPLIDQGLHTAGRRGRSRKELRAAALEAQAALYELYAELEYLHALAPKYQSPLALHLQAHAMRRVDATAAAYRRVLVQHGRVRAFGDRELSRQFASALEELLAISSGINVPRIWQRAERRSAAQAWSQQRTSVVAAIDQVGLVHGRRRRLRRSLWPAVGRPR